MNRFKPTLGSEARILDELAIRLHTNGMNGGICFDTLVGRNLPVELVYSYTPAHTEDGEELPRAVVKIAAVRVCGPTWFDSESGGVLSYGVGHDLLGMMNEPEVEALEEELLKKLEA